MKLQTKLAVMLLTLLVLLGAVNAAMAEKEGDFEYTITDGKATITKYTGKETDLVIPSTLGGMPVVTIGNSAFRGCTRLVNVTFPDSVTALNSAAFSGCTALTSITIPDSVTSLGNSAFIDCTSLTSITIPASVTSIASSTFSGCTNLISIAIPDSVISIGNSAFSGCCSLTSITIPDSVKAIGSAAFKDCTSLTIVITACPAAQSYPWPAGVQAGLFDGDFCYTSAARNSYCLSSYSGNASTVIIPHTYNGKPVTEIDGDAFDKSVTLFVTGKTTYTSANPCWRYTVNADGTFCLTGTNIADPRLILPAEACGTPITAIGDYAFAGMDMSFVYIPDSIVTVGDNPFRSCKKLTTIIVNPENTGLYVSASGTLYSKADKRLVCFPAGLTADSLTIPEGVQSIGAYALRNVQVGEIILPDTLTAIGQSAFEENERLTEIILPDGVTTIAERAFANCPGLAEITFSAALESIGSQAFLGCDSLLYLVIPDMVKSIGTEAFAGCSGLQLASIPASVTQIGKNAFIGAPLLTLYVQPGSYAAAYARENLLHALYPDSDSWLTE